MAKTIIEDTIVEKTFAMIKPDAVRAQYIGKIIGMIEREKFDIIRMEMARIPVNKAEEFYAEHKNKPFFRELVDFVTSGPVVLMALKRENAIQAWRELMGATNPAQAKPGTVRQLFGTSIGNNAAHGSDGLEAAKIELKIFFPNLQ
jgi:nucleoside-diphosphate kinase